MNTLIVINHPYENSFCRAILEAAKTGAAQRGSVDVIDLDADGFNPVMSRDDLAAFVKRTGAIDPQAKNYIERLKAADALIMIFPIWWELMPALTKGFIDKVIFPGETYDHTDSPFVFKTRLTGLKSVRIVTTMNTPALAYRFLFGNAIQRALVRGTFKKTGVKNATWRNLAGVKSASDEQRKKWLEQVRTDASAPL